MYQYDVGRQLCTFVCTLVRYGKIDMYALVNRIEVSLDRDCASFHFLFSAQRGNATYCEPSLRVQHMRKHIPKSIL